MFGGNLIRGVPAGWLVFAAALIAEFCTIYYGGWVGGLALAGLLVIALTPALGTTSKGRRVKR